MRTAEVEAVFDRLREELVPLIRETGGTITDGARARPVPGRRTGGARHHRDDRVRLRARSRSASTRPCTRSAPRSARATSASRPGTATTTSSRSSAACTRSATGSTSAVSAPRSSGRRSPRAAHPACTRARAASGRTSSAARCRSAAGSYLRVVDLPRTRSAGSRSSGSIARSTRCSLVHPRRRGRGHLRHAHHPPLRARAGADRGHAGDGRPARGLERPLRGVPRDRRCRTTRWACSRTCTGRAGSSATSRRTSSAT